MTVRPPPASTLRRVTHRHDRPASTQVGRDEACNYCPRAQELCRHDMSLFTMPLPALVLAPAYRICEVLGAQDLID